MSGCFSEHSVFMLSMNETDCHSAAVSELTLHFTVSRPIRIELTLCKLNYGVCYVIVRSSHPLFSARSKSMSQPAAAATRPHPGLVHDTRALVSMCGHMGDKPTGRQTTGRQNVGHLGDTS